MYYLNDLYPEQEFELGNINLSKEEIIDFAEKYDPQVFHLDEAVATKTFGGLIASGWHTCCLFSKLVVDNFLNKSAVIASPGLDNIRFLHPVYVNDTLTAKAKVIETKKSKSKPDRGIVKLFFEMYNADGTKVLSMIGLLMMKCKSE